LFEPDEGRYAEIPREMLLRGEWVIPYLQGEPYLDKPPLLYWLVMGSYRLLGVHDWSARLVPALAIHAAILLNYWLGRRRLGERPAFWGALALSLAPGFLCMGRLLLLDGLLALWVTLSWFAAFEAIRGDRLRWGWWLTAAAACGLGILTKGPVALVLLLPPWFAYRWLTGRSCPVPIRAWGAFVGVLAGVVLPWYGAICLRMPAFAGYFLWEHNVVRFLVPFDHQRPVWFYGPILLGGMLPITLLVLPFLRFLFTGDQGVSRHRCPELGLVLLAGGWCVLFFSLSGCKLPTYVLPAFPPLALALGYYFCQSRWRNSWWVPACAVLMTGCLGAVHYFFLPLYALYHSPLGNREEIVRSCGSTYTPIVCYPRNCDSVAFYLERDDFRNYRSKYTPDLVRFLKDQRRTVILFTHRHSLEALRPSLPGDLRLTGEQSLGWCPSPWANWAFTGLRRLSGETRQELYYLAVVEQRSAGD
ncbi:MAG: glycosyltransferase family 39 protein, partial [Planctomycetes bacterium]|nr:glycosyltransferase family 39 protein [Planctomycetota bacterium]